LLDDEDRFQVNRRALECNAATAPDIVDAETQTSQIVVAAGLFNPKQFKSPAYSIYIASEASVCIFAQVNEFTV
jgi:hypothetical protein